MCVEIEQSIFTKLYLRLILGYKLQTEQANNDSKGCIRVQKERTLSMKNDQSSHSMKDSKLVRLRVSSIRYIYLENYSKQKRTTANLCKLTLVYFNLLTVKFYDFLNAFTFQLTIASYIQKYFTHP